MKSFIKKLGVVFLLLAVTFCSTLTFSGCKNQEDLTPYLSQLHDKVYLGENEYSLKSVYGFKETPFLNDGKIGDKEWALNFTLKADETSQTEYLLQFKYNSTEYSKKFTLNAVKGALTCSIKIDEFTANEFMVELIVGSKSYPITMRSTLPEGTLSYKDALSSLLKEQKTLIENYEDENGNFNGEIRLRVIVKDDKPYYYAGLIGKDGNLKALLIDGLNGKILAVREVF
ncbi:MAG: hypothetical protein IKZ38_02415 [Clostridia bacterium]|nr:hypothetical protein [Clostridia bacterium]